MGIGTSLGAFFEDDFHLHSGLAKTPKTKDDAKQVDSGIIMPESAVTGQFGLDFDENEYSTHGIQHDGSPIPVSDVYSVNPMLDVENGVAPLMGSPAPERVGKAAIKVGEEIFTGDNHGFAFEKFLTKYPDKNAYNKNIDQGFMTSENRFISREEAMGIAKKQDQLTPDVKEAIRKLKAVDQDSTMLLSEDLKPMMQNPVQQQQAKAREPIQFRRPANENKPQEVFADETGRLRGPAIDRADAAIDASWKALSQKFNRGTEIMDQREKLRRVLDKRDWSDLEKYKYEKLGKEHSEMFPYEYDNTIKDPSID